MFLEHNSQNLLYRNPQGAVKTNTRIYLRIMVKSFSAPETVLCIINSEHIKMHYVFSAGEARIYECFIEMPVFPQLLFYCFYVKADGEELYYENNSELLGGFGQITPDFPQKLFQITVYSKDYKTPDWMKNAVVYQIFPDRFYRGKDTPFHGIEHRWNEEPYYLPSQFGGEYLSNDFFGGNLDGIRQKLPYLKSLGITAVYLNPIFKAFSNHRYDTADYESIDPLLGTDEDFDNLIKDAAKMGIRIILDGVFSHTGADSRYFNKYGTFPDKGAYQSKKSPYFSWYSFSDYPDKYDCWWGFDTLPNTNEMDEGFSGYIAGGKNSVIRKWIRRGIGGFRLDVADELPDEFIEKIRKALKEENPDSLLTGEVWEDASNKISYGKRRRFLLGNELDSVMNYVFRHALLSYLLECDAYLFSRRINSMIENYPKEALYTCMNLISSHDVPRAITVLSGAPDFRTLSREAQHDYVIDEGHRHLAMQRMVLAICIQMTMPGAPTVYYGDEAGMYGYADPFNRAPMKWDSQENEIMRQTKIFTSLRNSSAVVRTGFYKTLYHKDAVIAYMRYSENGKDVFGSSCTDGDIIIIVNASGGKDHISMQLDEFFISRVHDTFTGEVISEGDALSLCLEPYSYRVLTSERKKNICTKIQNTQ